MNRTRLPRWCIGGFAVALLVTVGCGQRTLPVKQTQPIQGKLLHGGEPLRFVLVHFEPTRPGEGAEAHGRTEEDGTFTLRTYSNTESDGVVPGEYKVTIEPYDPVQGGPLPEGGKPTEVTPELKNSSATVEIVSGQGDVTIDIP